MPKNKDITVLTKIVDMNYKEIGKAIEDKRKELGIDQEQAAELCGMSRRSFQIAENGEGKTSIKSYNNIAKKLKIKFNISFPINNA